ncbi:glycoside hydrolase family 19 protein [Rhizobium leguminosarum]|uniref:glycoside hydrolase family 19 protein n=1 Tax=Rhizobium leguminosarum TaxID=384 RepID=UPI00143F9045|nr:glycoside hydrolase family 19 protein [Rhizobium leguminosarum]NKL21562.1 hypothetical protein [Rhizobium leguminosarum bv. viciae]
MRLSRRSFIGFGATALVSTAAHSAHSAECGGAEAGEGGFTLQSILKFAPGARGANVQAILTNWKSAREAEIITPLRAKHFLVQCATETGGYRILEENLSYSSAERLCKVFPKRFKTTDQAAPYVRNPEKLANFVYGNRYGNDATRDGWRYRGSGYIQLTFRDNYFARGSIDGIAVVDDPDSVRAPRIGFLVSTRFWNSCGANKLADKDDLSGVRKIINGGTNGLDQARLFMARANKYLGDSGAQEEADLITSEERDAMRSILASSGVIVEKPNENGGYQIIVDGLQQLREEDQLPAINTTGMPAKEAARLIYSDDRTLDALTDPQLWRAPSDN